MPLTNAGILALTRELPIPVPWDRNVFIDNLASERGRPIRLISADTSLFMDAPCGLWLICDDEDVILHETGTSDYHIDQIVCHEIGHMMLGHANSSCAGTGAGVYDKLCHTALPDLDPGMVQAVLGRMDYVSDQEREAEMFASILMLAVAEANERSPMTRSTFFPRQ